MGGRIGWGIGIVVLLGAVGLLAVGPAPGTTAHLLVSAFVIVGGSTFLGLLLLLIMRHYVPHTTLKPHNDVMGFTYAAVSIINAVVLGFVVVTVWQQFQIDADAADGEAHAVADLMRVLPGLPPAAQPVVRQDVLTYLRTVITEEWPAMARGQATGAPGTVLIDDLWQAYAAAGPAPNATFYQMGVQRLATLSDAHRHRIRESGQGLPPLFWAMLVGGGALTIGFVYLFGVERGWAHAAMVGSVLASVALLLFLVFELQGAYSGDLRVKPDSFDVVLQQFAGTPSTTGSPATRPPRATPAPAG
jgi:hypothetical protein